MDRNLCVLIDFENIATGCEKEGLGRFDVRAVMRRLKDKGRILVARAYADWGRWSRFKQDLVEEGVSMMELTAHGMQAKNRADIALAVDAMELAYTREFIDTFVILSGDSDFTPLVLRLKELNKRVLGLGTKRSTSRLIADLCDEFTFYETVLREAHTAAHGDESISHDDALALLVETLENHLRDEGTSVHASVLKASMKRKVPTFSEVELGFRTFARFVETAAEKGLVVITRDERAGGYRVELPGQSERPEPSRRADGRRSAPPGASEGARAALDALSEAGADIGTLADREVVAQALVGAMAERSDKGRGCSLNAVTGDVLRRLRNVQPQIPTRVIRGALAAWLRAGALIHPDGTPVRSPAATFRPPELPTLRAAVAAYARGVLAEAGTPLDPAVDRELFGDMPRVEPRRAEATEPPPAEAAAVEPAPEAEDGGPRKRSRRGGRRGRRDGGAEAAGEAPEAGEGGSEAAGAPATDDAARPEAETAGEPAAEGGDAARPARRRRSRRGRGTPGEEGAAATPEVPAEFDVGGEGG